jgi:hypothetical protein
VELQQLVSDDIQPALEKTVAAAGWILLSRTAPVLLKKHHCEHRRSTSWTMERILVAECVAGYVAFTFVNTPEIRNPRHFSCPDP